MFRIECFVDDKNLARALIALQGVAIQQPAVQPVINAEVGEDGIKATTSGSLCELFLDHIVKNKITYVRRTDIKDWLVNTQKRGPGSTAYLAKCGMAAGFLKKDSKSKGAKTAYMVVLPKGGR